MAWEEPVVVESLGQFFKRIYIKFTWVEFAD